MTDNFKGGLDLKFVADSEFESMEHVDPKHHASIIARNALRLLMMGWPSNSWKQLLSWPVFQAVFIQRSPALLKELRLAFQQGFELLFHQLEGQKLNLEQSEQVQLYLSNCLSLLPYSDLTPYESIMIPQNINNEWVLVDYHVTPIELTPTSGFKSFFIRDKDRVFAYGLEPINNKDAQSHLIFMGTTYPAGQGFFPQIKTDLKGFETVGQSLYESGIKRIKNWLLQQNDNVHVCGVSLGGSLSLLLAIHLGKHLKRVDALNPPGLHDSRYKSDYDSWDDLVIKPQVVVQQQGSDPVSLLGVWKTGWQILHVNPPEDKKGPNALCDHFFNYAGFAQTLFTYIDPEVENSHRKLRNFWLYSIGRFIIYYTAIFPYSYLARPALYYIAQYWSAIALGLVSLTGIGILIGITVVGILPSFLLLSALAATVFLSGFFTAHHLFKMSAEESIGGYDHEFANLHDPSLPRNPGMDIYNPGNKIEMKLSYKELNTYYKVMRCLIKNKNFLPSDDPVEHRAHGLSKKELLVASEQSENSDVVVSVPTTKAKALHIQHVLTLVNQIGIENTDKLKEAVEEDYRKYQRGKHR